MLVGILVMILVLGTAFVRKILVPGRRPKVETIEDSVFESQGDKAADEAEGGVEGE